MKIEKYNNVHIMNHPLIDHKITKLCDKNTNTKEFREIVSEIAMLMGYEALKDLKTTLVDIETPLSNYASPVVTTPVAIVPILRAGLGMVDGLSSLIPTARIGHIGLYRNEETLQPVEYYCKLPKDCINGVVVIVDPALATGGSAVAAIKNIKERGYKNIKMLNIYAAHQGLELVAKSCPDVEIYVAHYSEAPLNEHGYITSAFGDAGDRIFGTK